MTVLGTPDEIAPDGELPAPLHRLGELPTRQFAIRTVPLEEGARGYEIFENKEDSCVRPVFLP